MGFAAKVSIAIALPLLRRLLRPGASCGLAAGLPCRWLLRSSNVPRVRLRCPPGRRSGWPFRAAGLRPRPRKWYEHFCPATLYACLVPWCLAACMATCVRACFMAGRSAELAWPRLPPSPYAHVSWLTAGPSSRGHAFRPRRARLSARARRRAGPPPLRPAPRVRSASPCSASTLEPRFPWPRLSRWRGLRPAPPRARPCPRRPRAPPRRGARGWPARRAPRSPGRGSTQGRLSWTSDNSTAQATGSGRPRRRPPARTRFVGGTTSGEFLPPRSKISPVAPQEPKNMLPGRPAAGDAFRHPACAHVRCRLCLFIYILRVIIIQKSY
ncbi:hypothetical protein ACQJBY_005016 [Aegilops geniculata]